MTWFVKWLMQYNKAFVPFIMMGLYVLNQKYGWSLPVSEDDAVLIVAALTSLVVHQIPNKPMDQ